MKQIPQRFLQKKKAAKDGEVKYEAKESTSMRNTVAELKSGGDTVDREVLAGLEYDTQLKGVIP